MTHTSLHTPAVFQSQKEFINIILIPHGTFIKSNTEIIK